MQQGIFDMVVIGGGATALLDLWSVARAGLTGAARPDYGPVGRWIGYLAQGQFFHAAIGKSAPITGERAIGWVAHYAIGVGFAGVLLFVWPDWARAPSLLPALIVGIGSVAAPFLLMQPGMGAGFFANRTPNPNAARLRSLTTHMVFALGLYAAGWMLSAIKF
jgi:hypothetical protein